MNPSESLWTSIHRIPLILNTFNLLIFLFQNKLASARKAFDAFFKRYPYCYGYWKKYADMERKNGNLEEAKKVKIEIWFSFLYTKWVFFFFLLVVFFTWWKFISIKNFVLADLQMCIILNVYSLCFLSTHQTNVGYLQSYCKKAFRASNCIGVVIDVK